MATHSSVLAWRIPGTGEPGGLPSMGSRRVRHDWSDLVAAAVGMYVFLENPQFSFIQVKEQRKKTTGAMRTVSSKYSWFTATFVYLSNSNNYKQSSTSSIWKSPFSITVSGITFHLSSHHWFSLPSWAAASSVKSFLLLNVLRISSWVFLLIMLATLLHV